MLRPALLTALCLLVLLIAAVVWRIFRAETLPDRLMAGDLATILVTFSLALASGLFGSDLYLDAALAAALLAFSSTVTLARFVSLRRVF